MSNPSQTNKVNQLEQLSNADVSPAITSVILAILNGYTCSAIFENIVRI